jgi:hypothetical protein
LQAYALRKHPAVLLNLAQSCLRSNHHLDASRYFQQYLREATTATPAQRGDAERGLGEARTHLGRIEVTAPAGAEVLIDGERVGSAPLADAVDVEPGTHAVKAKGDEVRVEVAAGQRVNAKFGGGGGAPPPVAPPPKETPAPAPAPSPPATATLSPNEPPPADADTGEQKHKMSLVPAIVGFSIGGAGIITALAMLIAKSSAQNSANSVAAEIKSHGGTKGTCTSTDPATVNTYGKACSALQDDNNKVDTDAAIGNVGLAVGIVGIAFGAIWLPIALSHNKKVPEEPKPQALSVTSVHPIVGPRMNGLGLEGSF